MKITIELKSEVLCANCEEVITPYDDVVYWNGSDSINGEMKAGLYHLECYEANKNY